MSEDKKTGLGKPEKGGPARRGAGLTTPVWSAIVVVALVAGLLVGHFLIGGSAPAGTVSLDGKTTLASSELDSTIATYTYQGQTYNVTARQVITQNVSLESYANEDGTYNVPGPTSVVSYVQSAIIAQAAAEKGLTVSDEELDEFTTSMYGSADYASIASQYSLDEETAKEILRANAVTVKLRDSVVSTTLPTLPTKPTEPAEGSEDTPTADYATYVINLLGDEWDSEAGTWARTDGSYYATLSGYEIAPDSATYAAANAAYQIAYSAYTAAYTTINTEWAAYYNSLFSAATVQLGTVASPASAS